MLLSPYSRFKQYLPEGALGSGLWLLLCNGPGGGSYLLLGSNGAHGSGLLLRKGMGVEEENKSGRGARKSHPRLLTHTRLFVIVHLHTCFRLTQHGSQPSFSGRHTARCVRCLRTIVN